MADKLKSLLPAAPESTAPERTFLARSLSDADAFAGFYERYVGRISVYFLRRIFDAEIAVAHGTEGAPAWVGQLESTAARRGLRELVVGVQAQTEFAGLELGDVETRESEAPRGEVIAVDPVAARRELAEKYGALALDPLADPAPAAIVDRVKELTGGGASYAIDTTAIPAVVLQAQHALRSKGLLVALGLGVSVQAPSSAVIVGVCSPPDSVKGSPSGPVP